MVVGFLKLVAIFAICLTLGALFGALVAENNGYNAWHLAGAGAVVGIAFGLVAAGELREQWLDPFFPRGDDAPVKK